MSTNKYLNLLLPATFSWEQGASAFIGSSEAGKLVALDSTGKIANSLLSSAPNMFVSVKDHGAIGDGVANDTAAIVATIAAVPYSGGIICFPPGTYNIAGSITITKSIQFLGIGPADSGSAGARIAQQTPGAISFIVACISPVNFRSLVLINSAGGTAIQFFGTASNNGNGLSCIDACVIAYGAIGLDFVRAAQWTVKNCYIVSNTQFCISIQNNASVAQDNGDSTVEGCVISPTAAGVGLSWIGSGGTRIISNKFIVGIAGITVAPAAGVSTGDILISGNSIEDCDYGILLQAGGGNVTQILITGNQLAGQAINAIACSSNQIDQVNVVGNTITAGVTNQVLCAFSAVDVASFYANNFIRISGTTTAIYLSSASAVGVTVGPNSYQNAIIPLNSQSNTTNVTGLTPLTFTQLPLCANGSVVYCSDGTIANPVAGGGTGCIAKRLNGVWVGN